VKSLTRTGSTPPWPAGGSPRPVTSSRRCRTRGDIYVSSGCCTTGTDEHSCDPEKRDGRHARTRRCWSSTPVIPPVHGPASSKLYSDIAMMTIFDGRSATEDEVHEPAGRGRPSMPNRIIPTPWHAVDHRRRRGLMAGARTQIGGIGVERCAADAIDRPDVAGDQAGAPGVAGYLYPARCGVVATLSCRGPSRRPGRRPRSGWPN